mgnify:CR=1 FL=1
MVYIDPDEYFQFKSEFTAFDNKQWRKGGMTSNGLKESSTVNNYFHTPGRSNIRPDATQGKSLTTNDPRQIVSSIGLVQHNGLKNIASGTYGPGSLLSTNTGNVNNQGASRDFVGKVGSSPNKEQFVNYRDTDPALVNNLRNNPLSIYASGKDVKNAEIPAFFVDTSPQSYSDISHQDFVEVSEETKTLYIDNSPNVNILGLAQQNPFMGMGNVKAAQPVFPGKSYGGADNGETGTKISENLYNSVWQNDAGKNVESFSNNQNFCQNKALLNFSPGYNVSSQIANNRSIVNGPDSYQNLPWGPMKVTNDPLTQQGGIWQRGNNPWPTQSNTLGVESNKKYNVNGGKEIKKIPFVNPYANGMPGTLIA